MVDVSYIKSPREPWIDYIKGICMIAIILIHVSLAPVYDRFTCSWVLAGFFYVGGYTFKLYGSFKEFFIRKFKYLAIPVFSFGILNMIMSFFAKDISIIQRLKGIFLQIPGRDDDMWFIACLFVMELMYYFIVKLVKSDYARLAITLLLLAIGITWKNIVGFPLPWHIVNACLMIIFVELGFLSKKFLVHDKIQKLMSTWSGLVLLFVTIALYVLLVWRLNNHPVDIHFLQYGNILEFYIEALVAILVLILLSVTMEHIKNSALCKFIGYIGINSLCYYGLQSKVITAIIITGIHFGISPASVTWPPVYTLIVIILLAPLSYLITRYMPFMLGKPYKK